VTTYLLDANVFIQAKNLHYGFEFCPAFWDWLDQENHAGTVFSVERVGDEILAGDDELAEWTKQRPNLFLKPDTAMVPSLGELSAWANLAGYEPPRPCSRLRDRHPRGLQHLPKENQDPECLHRCGRQVHQPLRDAQIRTRSVRARIVDVAASFDQAHRLTRIGPPKRADTGPGPSPRKESQVVRVPS